MMFALTLALLAHVQEERVYEEMIVPYAVNGLEDGAEKDGAPRHVINVLLDGRIVYLGRVLDDPGEWMDKPAHERWMKLDAALKSIVEQMPKAPLFEGGPEAPTGSLLVRADLVGDFGPVLTILDRGARQFLWRFDLAVGDARNPRWDEDKCLLPCAGPQRYLPIELPAHPEVAEPVETTEIMLRVVEHGRKLEPSHAKTEVWKGEAGTRFRWDLTTRRLHYQIGPRKMTDFTEVQKRLNGMRRFLAERPLTIETRIGVTVGEALMVVDAVRGLGVGDLRFVGQR